MRAFHFRLQNLLRLREEARERALVAYAEAIARREAEEDELVACRRRLVDLREEVRIRRSAGFSGPEQAAYLEAIDLSNDRLREQENAFAEAKRGEEIAREKYLEADIAEKSLLRLKERREEEHFRSEAKKEERELEDVISARFRFQSAT